MISTLLNLRLHDRFSIPTTTSSQKSTSGRIGIQAALPMWMAPVHCHIFLSKSRNFQSKSGNFPRVLSKMPCIDKNTIDRRGSPPLSFIPPFTQPTPFISTHDITRPAVRVDPSALTMIMVTIDAISLTLGILYSILLPMTLFEFYRYCTTRVERPPVEVSGNPWLFYVTL